MKRYQVEILALKIIIYCCCSVIPLCPILSDPMDFRSAGFPAFINSQNLLQLMSIESVMPSNHLILCLPLLLLPSIFPSIRVFSSESALCISWPKYGVSTSASVLPMNIRDWFPLGWTGWVSLQSKRLSRVFSSSTVQKHQFFGTQPFSLFSSHIHTWLLEKIIASTRRTFVGKIISLLFNMLSRLVIAFLPKSKPLVISWLQ